PTVESAAAPSTVCPLRVRRRGAAVRGALGGRSSVGSAGALRPELLRLPDELAERLEDELRPPDDPVEEDRPPDAGLRLRAWPVSPRSSTVSASMPSRVRLARGRTPVTCEGMSRDA